MMPQLGILSTVLPEAATQVFERDCLVYLGTCVAPVGAGKAGETCLTVVYGDHSEAVPFGAIRVLRLGYTEGTDRTEPARMEVTLQPSRGFDVGAGRGRPRTVTATGGEVGLIIDARGRPMPMPSDDASRVAKVRQGLEAMALPSGV
jgi:hypothetical protein